MLHWSLNDFHLKTDDSLGQPVSSCCFLIKKYYSCKCKYRFCRSCSFATSYAHSFKFKNFQCLTLFVIVTYFVNSSKLYEFSNGVKSMHLLYSLFMFLQLKYMLNILKYYNRYPICFINRAARNFLNQFLTFALENSFIREKNLIFLFIEKTHFHSKIFHQTFYS